MVVVSDNTNPFGDYTPMMAPYVRDGVVEVVPYNGLHERHFESTLLVEL